MIWNRCLDWPSSQRRYTQADRHPRRRCRARPGRISKPAVWRVDGDAIEAASRSATSAEPNRSSCVSRRAAASRIPGAWPSLPAVGLAVGGRRRADLAAEALHGAAADHQQCPVPFELARTLLIQGQVCRRLKQSARREPPSSRPWRSSNARRRAVGGPGPSRVAAGGGAPGSARPQRHRVASRRACRRRAHEPGDRRGYS
jgi:hypothetical protein